jgi:hypothetical protein
MKRSVFGDGLSRAANRGRLILQVTGAVGCVMAISGCVGEEGVPRDNTAMLAPSDRVSTVPWNKPQGWENTSQLGALANDPRIGGGGSTASGGGSGNY